MCEVVAPDCLLSTCIFRRLAEPLDPRAFCWSQMIYLASLLSDPRIQMCCLLQASSKSTAWVSYHVENWIDHMQKLLLNRCPNFIGIVDTFLQIALGSITDRSNNRRFIHPNSFCVILVFEEPFLTSLLAPNSSRGPGPILCLPRCPSLQPCCYQ